MTVKIAPRLLKSEPMQRCRLGECRGACCLNGVWVDLREVEDIKKHADLIQPHLPTERQDAADWFGEHREPDPYTLSGWVVHTTVLSDPEHYGGTTCIFLRTDFKCALQVAGDAAGVHPWRYKPFYCILHPLDMDEEGRISLDETETLLAEEASCLRPSETPIPLLETFEPELRYLLGDKAYDKIKKEKT